MGSDTPIWIQVIGLVIAASGWVAVLYEHLTSKPKLRARVFGAMRGQVMPDGKDIKKTGFVTYLYIVNTRRNSVHILDYEMEVYSEGSWHRLDRTYGIDDIPEFTFLAPDKSPITIRDFQKNLIYRKAVAAEYGKPLHGWIIFVGPTKFHTAEIEKYRATCIDAFGERHTFVTASKDFGNLYLLQDMAGLDVPPGALR